MKILVIPDLHTPFHHPAAFDFLRRVAKDLKPQCVVCIGDEIDAHGWSRHDRNPDAPGQGAELRMAKRALQRLYKAFPDVRVCRSNHGERAARIALRGGLPAAFIRDLPEVLDAPRGWRWAHEHRISGILFTHGEGYGGIGVARRAALQNRCNVVLGHVHSEAGVSYTSNGDTTIWGCSTGCLIDADSLAMEYARHHARKPVLGCVIIDGGVPHFLPLRG